MKPCLPANPAGLRVSYQYFETNSWSPLTGTILETKSGKWHDLALIQPDDPHYSTKWLPIERIQAISTPAPTTPALMPYDTITYIADSLGNTDTADVLFVDGNHVLAITFDGDIVELSLDDIVAPVSVQAVA